jgi:hypothetical protein
MTSPFVAPPASIVSGVDQIVGVADDPEVKPGLARPNTH